MGCERGEIEVGLSDTSAAAAVAGHVQQSLMEELMQLAPAVPSSSSSSLPSISIGSPEYSTLIRSMADAAEPSSQERYPHPLPLHPAAVQLPGLLPPVYGQPPFLGSEAEDAAIAEAMLAIISSAPLPPPASPNVPPGPSPPWLVRHRWSQRRRAGAFRAYSAALSPRARPRPGAPGQRMVKTAIALMLSVHVAMRERELAAARQQEDAAAAQPPPAPPQQHTSSQLHHMISERRRRERLNESFQTLRALLPPGSKVQLTQPKIINISDYNLQTCKFATLLKIWTRPIVIDYLQKDKATVLANTTEYMHKLIADVSNLEKKNRQLEAQLGLPLETQQAGSDDDSSERVQVDVTTGASTSAGGQAQVVSIRVMVRAECDLSEVVFAMLAGIKKTGRFAVVTVDARQRSNRRAQVSITLRVAVWTMQPYIYPFKII
jgi:hypothetical protein